MSPDSFRKCLPPAARCKSKAVVILQIRKPRGNYWTQIVDVQEPCPAKPNITKLVQSPLSVCHCGPSNLPQHKCQTLNRNKTSKLIVYFCDDLLHHKIFLWFIKNWMFDAKDWVFLLKKVGCFCKILHFLSDACFSC